MKKINLNLMKEHLTRYEMRAISGGSVSGGCTSNCSSTYYSCAHTGESGYGVWCNCGSSSTLYNVLGQVACQ